MLVANLLTPNGDVGCQTLKPSKELSDAYNLYMNPKTLLVAKPSFLEGGAGLPSSKPEKRAHKHTSEWCARATVSRQWCKVLKCLDTAPLAWWGIQVGGSSPSMHTYFYLLVILIGSLEPFQALCRAQAWMWDPGPYYERDTLVALVYLAVVASLLHFAEVLVEDTGEPSYPRPLRRMNPRRRRRLLQGISIWGPGRPPPRPNALKMCLRELRAFLAFEAHRIGRRRRRWGRSNRWKMQAGGWYRVRFLLRWRALRRRRSCAGDVGAWVPTMPPGGGSGCGGTSLGRGKFLEIDRMAGGGDAFLDGLMHFCATFRAQHDGDRELTRQVKAVEQIVARAQKQPGFDFLDGLQAFIEKERKNKAGQRGEPMSRAQVRTVQMMSDAEEQPRQRQWPNSGHDSGWTKNRGANWWSRQGAGRPDVSEGSWTSMTWKPRVGDRESAQSTNIHVIEGSVAFAKALDDHKDEPFLVLANDAEDFDVCVGMAEGERNAMATILLPCAAHWPEERSKPATVRVPGLLNRALQMRLCFWKSFCEGAPQLRTKKVIKPAKVQAFKPDATRRDGFVLRFICPWVYQQSGDQDWKRMIANPGAAARTWASQLSNLGTCLGDSFRFEIRDEHSRHAQLRGLLRVHTAEAALKLLQLSGSLDDKGGRWFTEPVHGDLGDKLPAAVLWIDWQDGERWQAYASRVARLGDTGLVLGRMQLGTRVPANDRRLKDRPSTWRVTNTPHMWTGDMVCDVLQTLGFRDVEVLQKLHRGATAHWVIKGIPPSLTELYQPTVADGAGKEHELVVIKEARRRRQDNSGHGLRSEHAVSYTPVVKPLRKDKRGSQVRQADGQGDAPMTGQDGANAAEAAKKAKTEGAPPQSKVKSPWLPEGAQRVQNTGKGDCLFLAIADALKVLDPSKNASGRSLRAFITAWHTRHLEEYRSLWDGLKAGVVSREANGNWNGSFEDYIADIKMAGVWGCYLELAAMAHALQRNVLVLDNLGQVTSFEHGGAEKAICLYFDRDVQHYEYLGGDIQDQLAFWATAHAGGRDASRDSGGGRGKKSSQAEGLLKLEDFASQASGSTQTRCGPRLEDYASQAGSSAAPTAPSRKGICISTPSGTAGPPLGPDACGSRSRLLPRLEDFASCAGSASASAETEPKRPRISTPCDTADSLLNPVASDTPCHDLRTLLPVTARPRALSPRHCVMTLCGRTELGPRPLTPACYALIRLPLVTLDLMHRRTILSPHCRGVGSDANSVRGSRWPVYVEAEVPLRRSRQLVTRLLRMIHLVRTVGVSPILASRLGSVMCQDAFLLSRDPG